MTNKSKVLITGGAGFLGLHLAKLFAKKKFDIYLLDITGFDKKEYPKNCHFAEVDIRDVQSINQLYKKIKPDFVVHAAAALPLWKTKDIYEINIEGTRNLLRASLDNKTMRFVHISSTAVYGVPKKHPVYESDPLIGVGPYGKSKIGAEKVCEEYRKKGLIVTVLRPKTFVGTHRLGVFEILFDWIKDGKRIPVIGSGKNKYQLLDVEDLVQAVYLFINSKDTRKINSVFNVGASKFDTVKQDFERVFKAVGSSSSVFSTPAAVIKIVLFILEKLKLSPLYQWVYDTADKDSYVSINRLIETVHWKPKYSNAQALIKAFRWYEKNYMEIKSRPVGITHTVGWQQGILGFFKRFL